MTPDRNCISYWFPKLLDAGLPVPKTVILTMPAAAQEDFWMAFDGKDPPDGGVAVKGFADQVRAAVVQVGGPPAFLRTGHTSAKHSWRETCFLDDPALAEKHMFEIAEASECMGFPGLPWSVWAVREMLPTRTFGICPNYGGMPVAREFRVFVDGGEYQCHHPYWPGDALQDGGASLETRDAAAKGCAMDLAEANEVYDLARRAGAALGGGWSIDILDTERGWFITDCAAAEMSFHWPGCPNAAPK